MTSLGEAGAGRGFLPDVNVWLALAYDWHEHHAVARAWFDGNSASLYFCRVTQMSLLRLLTNERVMARDVFAPSEAIAIYRKLLSDKRVEFAAEPVTIEARWESLMSSPQASGAAWTDAWLAAFAIEAEIRVITLDSGMRRWAGLSVELLKGARDS